MYPVTLYISPRLLREVAALYKEWGDIQFAVMLALIASMVEHTGICIVQRAFGQVIYKLPL